MHKLALLGWKWFKESYTYVTDNLDSVCVGFMVALETTLQFVLEVA